MILADRINLADNVQAIFWDMDGVLLDTLGLDLIVCNDLVKRYFGDRVHLPRNYIRSIFGYHPPEFWKRILEFVEQNYGISHAPEQLDAILPKYNDIRNNTTFETNPGILEILIDARVRGLKCVVVSNNPTEDVRKIITQASMADYFDHIVGNDIKTLEKKPAPDTYLLAAELLGVGPQHCVVVEDSLLGAEAGDAAGCYTIGVCTGSADFDSLESCPFIDCVYISFEPNRIELNRGPVTTKQVFTPNEFVSHMIEHIAWRLGCEVDLFWNNNDWRLLGESMGKVLKRFETDQMQTAAMGMIDDGSAEVLLDLSASAGLQLESVASIDLDWFLSLRCEQLANGAPLEKLLRGLSKGLDGFMRIRVCNLEDPHHTWEGIFRAVGIAMSKIFPEKHDYHYSETAHPPEKSVMPGDISILSRSVDGAKVIRKTAESHVMVGVDFSQRTPFKCRFDVSGSVRVEKFCDLLRLFSQAAGFSMDLDFNATALSSSHVAVEDTALVLGRALKEIFVLRMMTYGVNGAGCSIDTVEDFLTQTVRTGISIEGRKFWKIIPFDGDFVSMQKRFIIGQNVLGELFSEDLDDFLDGLAGGLGCSIVVHVKDIIDPDSGWKMIFENLGKAVNKAFAVNPRRKGVTPGVKATLA